MFTPEREASFQRFAELREDFLLDYGYNTARAYWADLDDILWWCAERGFDPLALTEQQFKHYLTGLRRKGYSESTVRRRETAWRGFARFCSLNVGPDPGCEISWANQQVNPRARSNNS